MLCRHVVNGGPGTGELVCHKWMAVSDCESFARTALDLTTLTVLYLKAMIVLRIFSMLVSDGVLRSGALLLPSVFSIS